MTRFDVVIVGSGHAGCQTAIALRQEGFAGSVAIVGEDVDLPYERPPLSKEYLAGQKGFERILIKPAGFWADRDIRLLPGRRVAQIDPAAHHVIDSDGKVVGYGTLVWGAGGHARRLSCGGHDLAGVHSVRSRMDVDRLLCGLTTADRVCVIGGGYIGLEAAAVLTDLGKRVTLLEATDRLLARVAGPTLSRFYEAEHSAHGVDIRLGAAVERIIGTDGAATGVRLADGEVIPCDMVVVGIGIVPAVEPLRAAGADCSDGVCVDAFCRTTLPDVLAIGDCARHRNPYAGWNPIRLESVQNANDMASVAARSIIGNAEPYHAVPWFWSNQYDLRLQTVGLSVGYDREIVRGDPASSSFSIVYLRSGRVVALDCVNSVKDFVQGKTLLLRQCDPDRLADPSVALKNLTG